MNLIVAIDMDHGIGKHGSMLYAIPEDLRYFKQMTYGKVIIMGRGTLLSLPGATPLPGRTNIVLSRNAGFKTEGAILISSLGELGKTLAPYKSSDVFVIGGESVYRQLMDYCEKAYITKIQSIRPADRFFPDIENNANWVLLSESETKEHNGLHFTFQVYQNLKVKALP